ncbi:MAG: hypothetical protein AB7G47_19925 [Mycolicibacterium sp.]|uniref:hypothetical protein n=1 Tax=Mycolicibacterium sp. TaxID=2320850 RepID=UPI003D0F4042
MTAVAHSNGGADTGPTPAPQGSRDARGRLAALRDHQAALAAHVGTVATEVVRAWLIEHERSLLSVEIDRSPIAPLNADESLTAAVAHLPDVVFRWGLDNRGRFTVRLGDLNEHLGLPREDRASTPDPLPFAGRVEIVGERDPDGGTDIALYIDGEPVRFEEYIIDAGWGFEWSEWVEQRAYEIASASAAVAATLYQSALDPPGSKYIENMPADRRQRADELDELIERARTERAEENR